MTTPFHSGELAVQQLAGESGIAERNGVAIGPTVMRGALAFLGQQMTLAVTVETREGALWTRLLFGQPGFLQVSPEDTGRLTIDRSRMLADDELLARVRPGAPIGALALDLATRRRLRINGVVEEVHADRFVIAVHESLPNCPKYITRRLLKIGTGISASSSSATPEMQEVLRRADLMYVGSIHPQRGADASHRGGAPGFIRITDSQTLLVPDYVGNSLFQTLGNIHVDPRASITVPDFDHLYVLHLSGEAEILWDVPEAHNETGGTGRWWRFRVHDSDLSRIPSQLVSERLDYSPFNPIPTP